MAFSWSEALKGAGGGALAGAGIGSALGPIGTLGGAAVGGIGAGLGALSGLLSGFQQDPKQQVLPRFAPEKENIINKLFSQSAAGNPSGFSPIENRAREQFQTQTIPSLAERFTAMGGGQRSGAFQQALGQHGSGLESELAALKSQYGQNQMQSLLPFLEQNYMQQQPGIGSNLLAGGLQNLPMLLIARELQKAQGGGNALPNASGASSQPTSSITSAQPSQTVPSTQGLMQQNQFNQPFSGGVDLLKKLTGRGYLGGGNI